MPRPASATSPSGYPLWDTFEVTFFLIAGICIGLVFGFLFPSMWRTLRRRFRNTKRYEASELSLSPKISPAVHILEEDDAAVVAENETVPNLKIVQAFVVARSLVQEGHHRDAVRVYLDILAFEQVSKKQTNRALYELAQTYDVLGLSSRSFDTAWELLNRKPENEDALKLILNICEKFSTFEKIRNIVLIYKGSSKPQLRMLMAHALCADGEQKLQGGQLEAAIELAREACRMSLISARARLLLWATSSLQARNQKDLTIPTQLTLLAADLESRWQIYKDTKVSAHAGAGYLADLFERIFLVLEDEPAEIVSGARDEFLRISGFDMAKAEQQHYEWICIAGLRKISQLNRYVEQPAIRVLIQIMLPQFYDKLLVNQSSALYERLSGVGSLVHKCQACGAVEIDMPWTCQRCEARESYQPFISLIE